MHFDKETTDFVIDGRVARQLGEGELLPAQLLHAAADGRDRRWLRVIVKNKTCLHPGFVVLDSPLGSVFQAGRCMMIWSMSGHQT